MSLFRNAKSVKVRG
ncbi:MAG TPA: hypothetical protein ENO19_06470 [Halothiobacillaceae bacterium]|nr:hypothetical protein [Halothiobacillaceae bacterium]